MKEAERIQKVLANQGVGSRREVERWITDGRIKVNGQAAELGMRISAQDKISLDGRLLKLRQQKQANLRVIMYHKPPDEICTRHDPEKRKTVFDRLPRLQNGRWISIGRLDITTSGLLLFTNDGELANRLMKPNYEIERIYAVRVLGEVSQDILQRLQDGVKLDDGMASFDSIQFSGGKGANAWYHVSLREGRNREVRRMWESQGVKVSRLIRINFGPIQLPPRLPVGKYVALDSRQLKRLCAAVDYRAPE